MSNIKMKVTLASMMLVAVLLALSVDYHGGIVPEVRAQGPQCNLRTLEGTYGNSFQFLNLPPGTTVVPQPIGIATHFPGAGIGVTTFDGQGNFSGSITTSLGGLILQGTVSGTYTVNPDCTGSQVINFSPPAPPALLDLVIFDKGKEVHTLSTVQGEIAFGTLKK